MSLGLIQSFSSKHLRLSVSQLVRQADRQTVRETDRNKQVTKKVKWPFFNITFRTNIKKNESQCNIQPTTRKDDPNCTYEMFQVNSTHIMEEMTLWNCLSDNITNTPIYTSCIIVCLWFTLFVLAETWPGQVILCMITK